MHENSQAVVKVPMAALLRKEIRQLSPMTYFWFGLMLLSTLYLALSERADQLTFVAWCASWCDPGTDVGEGLISLVLLLITAYCLYPKEHDDQTINFLYSLPATRQSVFFAKFLAAFLVVFAAQLLALLLGIALLSLNPQSIDGLFYPGVFAKNMLRDVVYIFSGLAYGVFLSCFRLLGMLVFFVYLALLYWWEVQFGGAGLISNFSVLRVDFYANELLLPWRAFGVQTFVSLVLLFFACRFWSRDASRQGVSGGWPRATRWLLGVAGIGLFVVLALVMAYLAGTGLQDPLATSEEEQLETTESTHYRFVSRRSDRLRIDYMAQHADDDYQSLLAILKAEDTGVLQADLTADTRHVAGLAIGKRLQLDINGFEPDVFFRRVLSHETVHVFQTTESGNRIKRFATATHFFIEGMAQYLSFAIVESDTAREKNWQLAAIAWKKQDIRFDDILNHSQFVKRHDGDLAYSLGDTWVNALVSVCGERVLGDFLRQVKSTGTSPAVTARQFWNENLQAINCSLASVGDQWRASLQDLLTDIEPRMFPDIGAVELLRDDTPNTLKVSVTLQNVDTDYSPTDFYLKTRAAATFASTPDQVFTGQSVGNDPLRVEYSVPVSQAPSGILEFQVGYVPQNGARPYYAPWRRGKVSTEKP